MGNTEIITAGGRRELDQRVLNLLQEAVTEDGIPRFLYLSPTRRKNRQMAALLAASRLCWRPDFRTPGELAERLLNSLPAQPLRWITEDQKVLIIQRIIEEYSNDDGSLSALRFRGGSTPLGVARHAAAALDYLGRRRLTPSDPKAGLSKSAGRALATLAPLYSRALRRHGLSDPVEAPVLAAEALRNAGTTFRDRWDLLVLDGFVAPEAADAEFIGTVADCFADRRIVLTLPSELCEALETCGWEGLPSHLHGFSRGREFFRRVGWDGLLPVSDGSCPPGPVAVPESLELLKYANRVEEVKGIAKQIKRIFHGKDTPASVAVGGDSSPEASSLRPEDFHVVVPRMDPYYHLFMELFPRYGIPFNITRGIPLSSIPVVSLITSLLDAVMEKNHHTLFNFFSLDLVTVPPTDVDGDLQEFRVQHGESLDDLLQAEDATRETEQVEDEGEADLVQLDIAGVDQVCRSAGILGGGEFQRDWLEPLAAYYRVVMHSIREDQDPDAESRCRKEFLGSLRSLLLLKRELDEFAKLDGEQPVENLVAEIEGLIRRYAIGENLLRSLMELEKEIPAGKRFIFEKNIKGFERAMEILSEITADLKLAGRRVTTLPVLAEIYRGRCTREMIHEAGELAGVSISQMLELRNLVRPVVFFAGLTADDFPVSPAHNYLLPSGPDSDSFRRSMDDSRLILHEAMANSDRVIFSYPASDGSDQLEPSPLLEDLKQALGLSEKTGEQRHGEEAMCRFELLREAGRSWKQGAPLPWDRIARILSRVPLARPESAQQREAFNHDAREALTAAILRSRQDTTGPYDGIIRDETALGLIRDVFGSPRFRYSVSMLNEYIGCPMRFFFNRVLGLQVTEEIPEEPEAPAIGSLVHQILARFYTQWIASGQGRIRPANRVEAIAAMHSVATEIIERDNLFGADSLAVEETRAGIMGGLHARESIQDPELAQKVLDGTDTRSDKLGLLRRLIDYEAQVDMPLFPVKTELAFGYDDNRPLEIPSVNGRVIRIRGRIDRVDLYRPDPNAEATAALVLDYKTGREPSATSVVQNEDIQLQVYLLALLEVIDDIGIETAGAAFLPLKYLQGNLKARIATPGLPKEFLPRAKKYGMTFDDAAQADVKRVIRNIDAAIMDGRFPRTSDPGSCKYCPFTKVCYRDDHRERVLTRAQNSETTR